MNRKNKIQLVILLLILLMVASAFAALKMNEEKLHAKEEETEEESYSVTQIDKSLVTEIGIINEEGNVNLIKEGEEWKCLEKENFAVDSSLVENFLGEACAITATTKIENVEDMSQYGLDNPSVNITLQWDNNMYTIKLGDYNSIISGYYLNINDESTVYVVNSSLYYSLNKTLEDFEAQITE